MRHKSQFPRRRALLNAACMMAVLCIAGLFATTAVQAAPIDDIVEQVSNVGESALMWLAPLFMLGAVTANQLIKRQQGCIRSYPVAASTTIYGATLVFLTAAGYADDDTATGANAFAGVARAKADNSAGSAGDVNVEVDADGIFELVGSGFAQSDVGKPVYATDNFTITTGYSASAIRIGRCEEYISSTKIRVSIETSVHDGAEYAALAASAAVTNTTTQTAFDKAHTIPANTLRAGDIIRVRAQGIATATNSTDTLAGTVRLGTTDVVASPAVDVANNDIFVIDVDIVIRTVGAGGTFVAAGAAATGVPGTATMRAVHKASTAVDTTADISVNVTATWSVANAGNSCRLDVLDVQIIRKR
jgi:hypothetical protein